MARTVEIAAVMDVGVSSSSLLAAVSPCPNDTYIFGAWVLGMVGDVKGFRTRFIWQDVQTLNEMAARASGDLIKVSAVQAMQAGDKYDILPCGGALSLGHGPKLVVPAGRKAVPGRIAVPGMQTTAYALLKACADFEFEPLPMPFDAIPAAVACGQVDAGLLIHETALIHKLLGLDIYIDLGTWWAEISSGLPLPLGLIIIKKNLGRTIKHQIEAIIRQSIIRARDDSQAVRPLIKSLASEIDDSVLDAHLKAYVNEYSFDIGTEGRMALSLLSSITSKH